jgi:hypothetical protein
VLACGTRWGKSTCAAMECIAALMEPRERTLGWLVAPSYELTRRIFERVVAALRSHLAHRVLEFIPREHRITVANLAGGTSELRAKTADRQDGLLGDAVDFIVIDEAASVRDSTWEGFLAPRLLDRDGWSLMIGTPRGRNWFYDEWKRGQKQRESAYESWQAPTTQNPHIKPELIEAERARLSADRFAEQYEAKFLGPPEPCEFCGWPDPNWNGAIMLVGEDAELQHCPACGEVVDTHGDTLLGVGVDGNPTLAVVRCDAAGLTEQEIRNLDDWNAPRKLG